MELIIYILLLMGLTVIPWFKANTRFNFVPEGKEKFRKHFQPAFGVTFVILIVSILPIIFMSTSSNSINAIPILLSGLGILGSLIGFSIAGIIALRESAKFVKKEHLFDDILDE